ncbi:ABC transporter permease [Herbiconiux sp. L3-i23]|uniref:ABC transporter permease n=1 Tax=Herbiconiux sp. L3-i23 TaxID=2905871 RepID=UPI00206EE200|nr:ABC transporter permease [Herbiconiux sp. L3-i23]BDI22075.1 transport permease protein [Herbiconiux sp. L3-i23]
MTTTTAPAAAIREVGDPPSGPAKFVRDVWTVFLRELWPTLRDPFTLIFSLLQPLVFLALFGPLLGGLTGTGGAQAELGLQWFLPGVLVMIALFGTGVTGSNLLFEIMTGSHERTLVAPVSRAALLIGRALKEMVPLTIQAAVIVIATIPFGFRLYPVGALVGLLLLAVFGVGLGALSFTLGLASRDREWLFWGVQQTLLFPLMILSGVLLPLDAGPAWLQTAAAFNPLTYLVAAERAAFAGDLLSPAIWQGALAAALTAAVGLTVGLRAMRRS